MKIRWSRKIGAGAGVDRGASAVLVGLMLVVLVAFGAFVIDVGGTAEERRDLQNGADAAALGIALDCAASGICTPTGAQPEAERLASANANDGLASVFTPDISFDLSAATVTVTARTLDRADLDGEIDYSLAPVIGIDSKAVQATAIAHWFVPSGGIRTDIPITFGQCEFNIATGGLPTDEDHTWPPDGPGSLEITIFFHTGEGNGGRDVKDNEWSYLSQKECYGVAGSDATADDALPGGYGWLQQVASKTCAAYIDENGWIQAEPGAAVPNGCDPNPDWKHAVVTVPIFDDIDFNEDRPCGSNKCYHVVGFATVEVTGFRFPGETWGDPTVPCKSPLTCLRGRFLHYSTLDPSGSGGGDDDGLDLGTYVVTLVG